MMQPHFCPILNDSKVWLIRHGESTSNIGQLTPDTTSISLTENGWEQARNLVKAFEELEQLPDLIITSSYLRTQQTAQPLLNRFLDIEHQEWSVQEFTYLSPCKFVKSLSRSQTKFLAEKYWNNCQPDYRDDFNVETFNEFMNRVDLFLKRLLILDKKFVVVFSHSYFIKAVDWVIKYKSEKDLVERMKKIRDHLFSTKFSNAEIMKLVKTGEAIKHE